MLMMGNPQRRQTVTFLPKWKSTEIAQSQRCRIFSRNILICLEIYSCMCSLIFCANDQVQVGNRFHSVDNSRYLFVVHENIMIQRIRSPNTNRKYRTKQNTICVSDVFQLFGEYFVESSRRIHILLNNGRIPVCIEQIDIWRSYFHDVEVVFHIADDAQSRVFDGKFVPQNWYLHVYLYS